MLVVLGWTVSALGSRLVLHDDHAASSDQRPKCSHVRNTALRKTLRLSFRVSKMASHPTVGDAP